MWYCRTCLKLWWCKRLAGCAEVRKETRFKYLDFTTIGFESLLYFFAGQTNKNYFIKTLILNPVRTSPGRLKRLSSSSFWLSVGRLFNILPALKIVLWIRSHSFLVITFMTSYTSQTLRWRRDEDGKWTFTRSHTDAAHQEEFRVQHLARGHFEPAAGQTSNLSITRRPPEPQSSRSEGRKSDSINSTN